MSLVVSKRNTRKPLRNIYEAVDIAWPAAGSTSS
ncbi:hypothetical protein RHECNPAF_890028 [Rhizobium etli CNPAF512]|nr:hypothetical protein RHECNPAF_890028 [Rhizobium etli CNPAF512]